MRHLRTNSIYALKQIKKSVIVQNDMIPQFTMEIKLQKYLNHPNVLKLYGIFDEDDYIYLILEYMEEGTLYYQLKRKKVLKQGDASRKLRDILEGMAYLHAQKIAHRDIKPENIVISHVLPTTFRMCAKFVILVGLPSVKTDGRPSAVPSTTHLQSCWRGNNTGLPSICGAWECFATS